MNKVNLDELVEEVSKLNMMNEDELYAILGYQSLGLEEKASELRFIGDSFSITKSELIIRGRYLFGKYKQQLGKRICDDWGYCRKKKEYVNDINLLSGALIPIIIAGINIPASLATVLFTLALKYGLNKLCECKE